MYIRTPSSLFILKQLFIQKTNEIIKTEDYIF